MSEAMQRIFLSDLAAIRVCCKARTCGGVVELSAEKLGTRYRNPACPLCGALLFDPNADNPFVLLSDALQLLQQQSKFFELEFLAKAPTV